MRELRAWLQQLGLSKFVEAFENNEIDFDTLPHLTDNMLVQMGLPIGPRAKLLAAISKLPTSSGAISADGHRDLIRDETTRAQREAERRQITIMFCDLVDSTKLAGHLDPEDFQDVMARYQKASGASMQRHGGHISQYRGDGLEVYFGWPTAQEDAAERAVRAGLEVIEAVTALSSLKPLSVRVGINTGVVVISEAGSGDPSKPSGAVGEAIHVAARLQSIALPNSVVIGETTSRLVSGHFVQEDLGPQALKGLSAPIQAFRVLRAREHPIRFQAGHLRTLTPLVGRHAELSFLQQCWRDAKDGEGQAVFLAGIAGIGKSRIAYEFEEGIKNGSYFGLTVQCSQHHVHTPLFPVIQLIQRLGGLRPEDPEETRLLQDQATAHIGDKSSR